MQPQFVLKPNVKKVSLINLSKVILGAVLIVGIMAFSIKVIDFSIITETLGFSEEELPGMPELIINFIVGIIVVSLLSFLLSYMSQSKIQYIFYSDRVEMNKSFIIFTLKSDTILYNNISSVRVEKEGAGKLFNMGNIILELTGTEKKSTVLENLDDVDTYIQYIQKLLQENQARYGMQYQFDQKIQNTLDRI